MRLTRMLLKYRKGNKLARAPQDIKAIPFDPILPLRLRDRGFLMKIYKLFPILIRKSF